jgi:hypothetical protein
MPDHLRGLDIVAIARLIRAIGVCRRHGIAPSWRRAARDAGWTWNEQRDTPGGPSYSPDLAVTMYRLRAAGLIRFSTEPRSLDLAPGAAAWALEVLHREQAEQLRSRFLSPVNGGTQRA